MAKEIEYFIAQRTSKGEKRGGGGVMMPVAKVAVALSIAVMVITLAVIFGFKREIENHLTALSGQLLITSIGGGSLSASRPIEESAEFEKLARKAAAEYGTEVVRVAPFVSRGVILRSESAVEGIVLKGVDQTTDIALFREGLIEGEVPNFGTSSSGRNALISKELADEMRLSIGEKLELLTTDSRVSNSGGTTSFGESIRRDLYRVGGVYTRGLGDAEKRVVMSDIRHVQLLNNFNSTELTGYEIWIEDTQLAPEIAERVNHLLLMSESDDTVGVACYSAQSLYPAIFDWLAAHNVNALVIIIIMLIVATFNITTAMLIMVLERTQLIGQLKVLGMSNNSIRKIFLYRALSIALWGMLWGNGVAIALCLAQKHLNLLRLDEEGYMLSSVPISLGVDWLLMLNVVVVIGILLLVVIPTRIVSKIEPSKAMKFD